MSKMKTRVESDRILELHKRYRKKNRFYVIWERFRVNKLAVFGLILFLIILFASIFADLLFPYEEALRQDIPQRLDSPSMQHWLGTDGYGRDIFIRIVHGGKYSLLMGIVAVFFGLSIGSIIGATAGYYGKLYDSVIMRFTDTIQCIPFMLLAMAIVAALGTGLVNVLIALTIAFVPYFIRVIRSAVLSVTENDFIEAAKSCGTPNRYIILKHVLPNAVGPIIVQAATGVGAMILWASSLSYIGMGIQPPTPEWGSMLSESRQYIVSAPHTVIFPGLAIVLTVLSLNLMGDGLRDALDPRLKD